MPTSTSGPAERFIAGAVGPDVLVVVVVATGAGVNEALDVLVGGDEAVVAGLSEGIVLIEADIDRTLHDRIQCRRPFQATLSEGPSGSSAAAAAWIVARSLRCSTTSITTSSVPPTTLFTRRIIP